MVWLYDDIECAQIAKKAHKEGSSLREAALSLGYVTGTSIINHPNISHSITPCHCLLFLMICITVI
jgi:fumarate hydratase class II